MWIPLRPSGQLWTNQKAVPGARAQVEQNTKFHTIPRRPDFLCLFT